MKIVVLSAACLIVVIFVGACGRKAEDPAVPVERMPSSDYEEIIEFEELPDAGAPYRMPDIETDEDPAVFPEDIHVSDGPGEIEGFDESEQDVLSEIEEEPVPDPRKALRDMEIEYHKWAFIEAAGEGKLEAVKLFIQAGMDVDEINSPRYGETALIWAARGGHAEVVRFLIASGAKVNKRNAKDMTALGYALMFNRREAAGALREAGGER